MYSMDNLLTLVTSEQARELRFRAGAPPIIVMDDEPHALEGPPITAENVAWLLRSIATSREMRELKVHGVVEFIYHFQRNSPFLVRARMRDGTVSFDVE
jgi:twitching motility protein PilT